MGAVLQLIAPEEDCFEMFWTLVWRKEAKKDTRVAWAKIPERDHIKILEATLAWRPVYMARETVFRPLPATWLRGERYEDALPEEFVASCAPRATVLPELPRKSGEIPEKVKAMLAKLKAQ